MVVCEGPEARLSVNDKTTYSDEVNFNTEVHKYIFTASRDKLDCLINQSSNIRSFAQSGCAKR